MWLRLFIILTSSRSQLLSGGPLYSYPPLVPSNSHGAPFATSPQVLNFVVYLFLVHTFINSLFITLSPDGPS